MLKFLTPSLLALAIGVSGLTPLFGATEGERDQHALALFRLMANSLRLPADRQLKEYQAAAYPSSDPYLDKALRSTYLDRFLTSLPEKDKAKNEAEAKALKAELDAALKANKLSATTKLIYSGGGGSSTRMVNEIAKIMHPDAAPPIALDAVAVEKKQALSRMLEALAKQAEEDFKEAVAKVKAHKADEDKMWEMEEKNPLYRKIIDEACNLRIDALRPFYTAHIALRDAAARGKEFGIDPAPIQARLKQIFTQVRPEVDEKKPQSWTVLISAWDFEWGEFTPYIRCYANVLLSESFKQGDKAIKEDDVESGLQAVADFDTKEVKDPNAKIEAYRLKLTAWSNLLRFRLEIGTARSWNKAITAWQDFQERGKTEPNLKLGTAPTKIAGELGKLQIIAARIYRARGDSTSASGLAAEVAGVKPANPAAGYAKGWMVYWNVDKGGKGSNPWAQPAMAGDPAKAILVAKAYMSEASATANAFQARNNYLSAAVALRGAILGLSSSGTDEKSYIEFAPDVYWRYALALSKLEMRYHAAIAAQEGVRAIADRAKWYADNKKPNPWRKPSVDGKLVWNDSDNRITPLKLANDGMLHAKNLYSRNKSALPLYNDSIELLKLTDPEAVGKTLEWTNLTGLLGEGNFEGAIKMAQEFMGKYPDWDIKAFTLITSARTRLIEKLTKDGQTEKTKILVQETDADNKSMEKRIGDELAKGNVVPDRQKELQGALNTINVSGVERLLADKKHAEVLDKLGPDFWKNPPSDDTLAARMLRLLGKATLEFHKQNSDGDKAEKAKDAATLLANYKRYDTVYAKCVQKGLARLKNKGVDSDLKSTSLNLANVFASVVGQAARLQTAGQVTPEVLALVEPCNRSFADLYEPWVDQNTPANNIIFIANKLWEVGEHARAASKYELFRAVLDADIELQTFKKDPKPVVDRYGEIVSARAELKKPWEEIADLSWDTEEFKQAYANLPKANWPAGLKAD